MSVAMDEVAKEHGPVCEHLPRSHQAQLNRERSYVAFGMTGRGLTKELVEESFEAMRRADRITVVITRRDGRKYQLWPRGFLRWRVLWNWLRGYRKPRGA